MPDAGWWDGLHTAKPKPEQLAAEVRRLRSRLQHVEDELRVGLESKDWGRLHAAAGRALAFAGEGLRG